MAGELRALSYTIRRIQMPFRIVAYIPIVSEDEETIFNSIEDAENEADHLRFMQPENKYEVEEVDVR